MRERSQYSFKGQIGDAQNRCYHQMCIHRNALEKSQKHLITNLFTHSSTMFKNRPKCLALPNNVKKRLDGVISKDFALIRKLHLQFLTSLKLIFPFLIDFSARISTQVSGINNRITSIQICK